MKKIVGKEKVSFVENDKGIAIITFPEVVSGCVNLNHTHVDPDYRGMGLANKLMEEAISVIEQNNWHCIASCSYAKDWFTKHPEKQYLLGEKSTCNE